MKLLLLLLPSIVLAGGSGHGSPMDLIPSFVNVAILASLLVWKLKAPIREHFINKSDEVSNVMKRAETKAKEAKEMMDINSKKMANSDKEITGLKEEAEKEVADFKAELDKEVMLRIERLRVDSASKIEAEKKSLSDSVNNLLVDNIIAKSKNKIKEDSGLSKSSTEKILKDL